MVTQVDVAFNKLLRCYGKKKASWRRLKNGKLKSSPGWVLDQAYGGYRVAERRGTGTGEYDLFDNKRRGRAEFIRWVDAVCAAKRQR